MNIWLITVGEPLPLQGSERLLRTGILSKVLSQSGHRVTWWTSTFDHVKKKHLFDGNISITCENGTILKLLHAKEYKNNVSLNRIINHYGVANKFTRLAEKETKPDIILCSLPTIELSLAAIKYGKKCNVPVVVDIRDLWPDIFLDFIPKKYQFFGKLLLLTFKKNVQIIFRESPAITAVSEGYLQWGLQYAKREKTKVDCVFPLAYEKYNINEIELEKYQKQFTALGIDRLKKICWFVGTFGKTYDLNPILNTARQFKQSKMDSVQFVFSGDGENYSKYKRDAHDLNNVIFTGWIGAKELAYLMRVAYLGIMAYASKAPQGLPNKLFEYLSAGLPIVSSLNGETNTLLRTYRCGLSYNSEDFKSCTNVISTLINDEKLHEEMRANAKKLFDKNYSASVVYTDMANYLIKLSTSNSQENT